MVRSFMPEMMEDPGLPDDVLDRVHRDLTRMHGWLGNTGALVGRLRRDPLPVRRVLDIGCGYGGLLLEIQRRLGVDVIGVELRLPPAGVPIEIVRADAIHEPLPPSDVAISVCLAHHLSEPELIDMIRNVGRFCRRFIVLDLVRHRLPLELFRCFVGPWVNPINAADGERSVERSYTPPELPAVVRRALDGTGARFQHSVAPFYIRQVIDISYPVERPPLV